MGACFECLAVIDGRPNVQTCMTPVCEGMRVETQDGALKYVGLISPAPPDAAEGTALRLVRFQTDGALIGLARRGVGTGAGTVTRRARPNRVGRPTALDPRPACPRQQARQPGLRIPPWRWPRLIATTGEPVSAAGIVQPPRSPASPLARSPPHHMGGLHRGLQLKPSDAAPIAPARRSSASACVDHRVVPRRDSAARPAAHSRRRVPARRAAGFGVEHQREQPQRFGFVGQQRDHEAA